MGLEDSALLCGTESRPALSGMSFGAEGPADFFPVLSSNLFSNRLIHLFVYSARYCGLRNTLISVFSSLLK